MIYIYIFNFLFTKMLSTPFMTLFTVFSMLYTISTTFDCMHQLFFLYMLNYPVIYSLSRERERESGNKHARN